LAKAGVQPQAIDYILLTLYKEKLLLWSCSTTASTGWQA